MTTRTGKLRPGMFCLEFKIHSPFSCSSLVRLKGACYQDPCTCSFLMSAASSDSTLLCDDNVTVSPRDSTPKRQCFADRWARPRVSLLENLDDEYKLPGPNSSVLGTSVRVESPEDATFDQMFPDLKPYDTAPRWKCPVSWGKFELLCNHFPDFRCHPSLLLKSNMVTTVDSKSGEVPKCAHKDSGYDVADSGSVVAPKLDHGAASSSSFRD